MINTMKISVIIPTYNGAHRILTVLKSLQAQQHLPDEVLVIIDGSTDGTRSLLDQHSFAPLQLNIVERSNGGRAKVRNTGAAIARHDLLLFIDDDMIAPPDWVGNHYHIHSGMPGGIVTGMLQDPPQNTETDFLRFKTWLHKKWTSGFKEHDEDPMKMTTPYLTANNMSIAASTFQQLQGFDERLTDAEDYDMAVRALKSGISLYFSRVAVAVNNDIDNVSCARYIRRVREYTAAQRRLQQLKPELYPDTHQYSSKVPQGLKGAIFKFFCKPFWIHAVDNGGLRWLPAPLRYKLYDIILTANGTYFTDVVPL
jgi:glycosyltransferase involved in cell wall biosynthesis